MLRPCCLLLTEGHLFGGVCSALFACCCPWLSVAGATLTMVIMLLCLTSVRAGVSF